ncbi:MAG: alanine racemase [Brevinematia bacterium]
MKELTYVEINLTKLYQNYCELVKLNDGKPIIPVIKADAYGHGAKDIMVFLFSKGIRIFAVARIEEALELASLLEASGNKKVFANSDILVFCPIQSEYLSYIFDYPNIIPIVSDVEFIKQVDDIARKRGEIKKIGIEIDTGMGRLGIHHRDVGLLMDVLEGVKNIELSHFMSHFPSSDVDRDFSLYQISLFDSALEIIRKIFSNTLTHFSNSGGVLNVPEASKYDFARCGLSIYGYYPNMSLKHKAKIVNSLTLKSHVVLRKFFKKGDSISYNRTYFMDRDGYIAVVPCGYADAIPTLYSNNMEVVINSKKYSVVGRITMDYFMVRVDESVNVGDEVLIFGGDHPDIRVEDFASRVGLIPYEVVCGISKRVIRKYVL